jgi:ABC-type branched-subunit amino acid transport system substrate-binding protein
LCIFCAATPAFRKRFEEYAEMNVGTKSAQGYDAVWAYFKAYAAAADRNSTTPAILGELAKLKFQGTMRENELLQHAMGGGVWGG